MECKINVVFGWKDCTSSPTTLTDVTYEQTDPKAKRGTTKQTPKYNEDGVSSGEDKIQSI